MVKILAENMHTFNNRFYLLLFIVLTALVACSVANKQEVEREIASSDKLKRVNQFCEEIPKPKEFEFVYKNIINNSYSSAISFKYRTRLSFSEVRDFYFNFFEREGWKREFFQDEDKNSNYGQVKYKKEKNAFWLEHVSFPNAKYSISCIQEY